MFNSNAQQNQTGLSRSVSQSDHSDRLLSCSKDQSSCSSLTSGIGQSDQSICNERVSNLEDSADCCNQSQQPQTTICSSSKDELGKSQQTVAISASTSNSPPPVAPKRTSSVPQYLRRPPVSSNETVSSEQQQQTMSGDGSSPSSSAAAKEQLRSDIKQFVDVIFTDSQSISLERKAEFGKLMRTPEARLLFAIFVDDYRVNSKRVSELTFYSLAQYFSIVLLECLLAEDFRPAKIIMNMMFTYYYEQTLDRIPPRERSLVLGQEHVANKTVITYDDGSDGDRASSFSDSSSSHQNGDVNQRGEPKTVKTYLYTLLKDQEIFKSIRFWTSAFYESVIIERNNHPVFVDKMRGKLSIEKRDEELDCSKNITFGLLGSFIHNMCLLDLSHEFCQEFLNKHSTIAGLSDYQLEMLRANLEAMFKETSSSDKAPISQATAGERLSKFLHKLGTRLNQSNSISSSSSNQQTQQQPK